MTPSRRSDLHRREFLRFAASAAAIGGLACAPRTAQRTEATPEKRRSRLFFTSQGKTAIIDTDGGEPRYMDFRMPNQVTWQPGPIFPDGDRVIFLSMEERRDGPGRPFDEYYTQTPTHIWVHDLESGTLEEICQRERLAVFYTPALLLSADRILVQVVKDRVGQIFSMRLDGTDARAFTQAGEGLPYGLSLSPDGKRVAYHLASPEGYQIWTCDVDGGNRIRIASDPDHLYFGTSWSPDGAWILYVDCQYHDDPGHDWADVCIGRSDGSEHRVLTTDQSMWFAATYGDLETKGGGSNVPAWTRDGHILYPRRLLGSRVAWRYRADRPDVDHFNRDFEPESARGGTQICKLDPRDASSEVLTTHESPAWDFRASESPDGSLIAFCRAPTGGAPGLWVAAADGTNPRLLTRGLDGKGADHPRWIS
jgi:Tol biopolymer transport system component